MQNEKRPARYVKLPGLKKYVPLGDNNAAKLGRDAKAAIRIGHSVLYDLDAVDRYLERERLKQHAIETMES